MHRIERALSTKATVYGSCCVTLALGLFFVFVWAPHPWGWEGFDHYHDLALQLARGRPFPTLEVPWGYAYFLAAFYRVFGDRPWIPLLAQVLLNASIPLLVFAIARSWLDERTAVLASLLTGVLSFNTVYASTQSSDAVCTWLFMVAIWAFIIARDRDDTRWFGLVGLLTGITPQFRPNLIVIPGLLAVYAVIERRTRRRLAQAAVLVICASAALVPWVVRNYRLTGEIIPTSVHAGVQLWYGTLQSGPYLHSRAYNPRSVFEGAAFDYTSLDRVSIIVEGQLGCDQKPHSSLSLSYWSDHDPTERQLAPTQVDAGRYTFEIPAPGRSAVIYFYFVTAWPARVDAAIPTTPPAGKHAPFVYFVSHDHLGDMDLHGDLLDIFDVIRLARHEAWNEPVPFADTLDAAGVTDARHAVALLMRPLLGEQAGTAVAHLERGEAEVRITLSDGSSMAIPRIWRGSIADVTFTGNLAPTLMTLRRSFLALEDRDAQRPIPADAACTQVQDIGVNRVFYRREPHMMQRYWTLAFDNIRRDPEAFMLASVYRAGRLFTIQGTSDRFTTQQFVESRRIYAAAMIVSIIYVTLFVTGVVVAWRRGHDLVLPLLLIGFLPATLAPVLTNMRYVVTVQPLMFMLIAVAVTTVARR
jgi:hypothetical protein